MAPSARLASSRFFRSSPSWRCCAGSNAASRIHRTPETRRNEDAMKLCRFGQDRLGVVIGDMVHDVTAAQDQIRAQAPYDMRGDAVIAALPEWRGRIDEMAKSAPGAPLASVQLLPPVARWTKTMAAPTNYRDHIAEMEANRAGAPSKMGPDIGKAGIFLKANSSVIGMNETTDIRFPDRRNDHEAEIVIVIG